MVDEDRKLVVVDEEGKEIEMEIILTFDDKGKNYVVYYDPNDKSEETPIYASIYDEEGRLYPVETDEEWSMIDEVVNCYLDDIEEGADA